MSAVPSLEQIRLAVLEEFPSARDQFNPKVFGDGRGATITNARTVFCYVATCLGQWSAGEIADAMGRGDHTTTLHHKARITEHPHLLETAERIYSRFAEPRERDEMLRIVATALGGMWSRMATLESKIDSLLAACAAEEENQ